MNRLGTNVRDAVLFLAAACVVLTAHQAAAQISSGPARSRPVISIDGRRVGIEEFESRLNLFSVGYPQDPVQRKRYVALSLVQELVLARAAREARLDTLAQVQSVIRQYEKEAAYEEWMNREVRAHVVVSDEDVSRAYGLYKQQRMFDYRTFPDSASARRAERRFRRASSKNAQATDTLTKTKTLEFGEAEKHVEDVLFAMKPGETRIVRAGGAWYLFRLNAVKPHPIRSEQDLPSSYDAVSKLVRKEKELEIFGAAMSALMSGRSFTLAPQAREHLYRLLAERIPFANPQISKFPEIVNQEIARRMPPETDLNERFLTFRNGASMSLGQLWNAIGTGPYLLNYRSAAELRAGLNDLIRRVILVESVINDAYRLGLERTPYVLREKAMWSDNLLSNLFQYHLSESRTPTPAELRADTGATASPAGDVRQRVLQQKTHAAIDSVMNVEMTRTSVAVDTTALFGTHALEGDIVVRKEHFPNRFVVPRLVPANPQAAWARRLLRSWGEQE